jgi:hypothetical protein
MKRFPALTLGCALVAASLAPLHAGPADKTLENVRGSVDYQVGVAAAQTIAPQGSIALDDGDYAITGPISLAGITLPDSSRVLIGSTSKVQLGFFNRPDIAHARFVIYQGTIRFDIEHPAGARADYTFATPAASIGVRGTQGDILSTAQSLQVNCYALSDAGLPIVVTFSDGRVFSVFANQGLLADLTASPVSVSVQSLSVALEQPFTTDFGAPPSHPSPNKAKKFWQGIFGNLVQSLLTPSTSVSTPTTSTTGGGAQNTPAQTTVPIKPQPTKAPG